MEKIFYVIAVVTQNIFLKSETKEKYLKNYDTKQL